MAVSGRVGTNGYRQGGATRRQFAVYLQRLGAYDGANLDGGNSTTLLVRRSLTGGFTRMDQPASSWQRPVPNVFTLETVKP